jgi:hypothetical protein
MQILTLISNMIYLFCAFYLLYEKHYFYGLLGFVIWLISHIYHCDEYNSDNLWNWKMNADIIISSISFIIVLINCHPILLCLKNLFLLFIMLLLFGISCYYYYVDINTYYVMHSLWHVFSALFILYLILKFHKKF